MSGPGTDGHHGGGSEEPGDPVVNATGTPTTSASPTSHILSPIPTESPNSPSTPSGSDEPTQVTSSSSQTTLISTTSSSSVAATSLSPVISSSDNSDSSENSASPSSMTARHTAVDAIAGGVIGAIVVLVIAVTAWRIIRKRKYRHSLDLPAKIRNTRHVDLLEKGFGQILGSQGFSSRNSLPLKKPIRFPSSTTQQNTDSPVTTAVSVTEARSQRYSGKRAERRAIPEQSPHSSIALSRIAISGEPLSFGGLSPETPTIEESILESTLYNVSSTGVDDTENNDPDGLRSEVHILRRQVAILQGHQSMGHDERESVAPPSYEMTEGCGA